MSSVKAAEVQVRCRVCSRSLGRYGLSPGTLSLLAAVMTEETRRWSGSWAGPRRGTRLLVEKFEGRFYLRVACKCGRNEKIGGGSLPMVTETLELRI